MIANLNKHRTLKALRQELRLSGLQEGEGSAPAPLRGRHLDPAIFGKGLHEILPETPGDHAAATVFALIAANQHQRPARHLFFGTLASDGQERGTLYGAGLHAIGLDPAGVLVLAAHDEKALLWAAEEAASCPALGAAVIQLSPRPRLYSFTASRRLKLRQEASGVPLFILRGASDLVTAATARWRVGFATSEGLRVPGTPVPLPGRPRFRVCLDRYAGLPQQHWEIELDEAHALRVVAPVSDRPAQPLRFGDGRAA